ncbi:MAG: enoyl-CoA hydratase [Hyphomicrobiales bacterium]|nr:enoyl-CoA hydratase [Hyphomicrobiales bacterium]MBV9433804.1 enoyl-CoA hydratase [Hyphomicrobiales bacterium]
MASARVPFVSRRDEGAVAILTLDHQASRNSLSEAMMAELQSRLDEIAREKTLRAVVLAAKGPVFCAGHDLKELTARRTDADKGRRYFEEVFARCSQLMQSLVRLPRPVIAAVDGIATAAGCQLVASCDLAVASPSARFATPGVNIGLFCSTPMVALSRNVSRKHAMEMLLTGEMITAEEAERVGLVNRVTKTGEMAVDGALELARQIAAKPPATVRIGKEAFYRQVQMTLEEAYAYTSRVIVQNMLSDDAREGIAAFTEKREPRWTGD